MGPGQGDLNPLRGGHRISRGCQSTGLARKGQPRVGLPGGSSLEKAAYHDIHNILGRVFGPELAFGLVLFIVMCYQIRAKRVDNFEIYLIRLARPLLGRPDQSKRVPIHCHEYNGLRV